MLAGTVGVVP